MFNFGTIGAYKQVRNNPRTKAQKELTNGQVVVLNEADKEANAPSAEDAKGKGLYVVFNIVDEPEVRVTNEFTIKEGDFVRAFRLADLVDMPVLVGHKVIADDYVNVSVGDKLAADTDGNWAKAGAEDAAITLEVIAKNGFANQGVEAIVNVGEVEVTP